MNISGKITFNYSLWRNQPMIVPTLKFFFFKLPRYTLAVQYVLYLAEIGYTNKIEREREGERER